MADIAGTHASPYASPNISHRISYTANRTSNSSVTYTFTVYTWITDNYGWVGNGMVLNGEVTVAGNASVQTIIPTAYWTGPSTTTYTIVVSSTAAGNQSCTFRAYSAGAGSLQSGTINLTSGYTVTAPALLISKHGTPSSISATPNPFEDSITVSWGAATAGTGNTITAYQLQYSTNSGSSWTNLSSSIGSSTRSYVHTGSVVTGISRGSGIRYQVRALSSNTSYHSDYRSMTSNIIRNRAPAAPTVVTLNKSTFDQGDSLILSWSGASDADNNIAGYEILYRQQENGTYSSWMLVGTITSTATSGSVTYSNCYFGYPGGEIQFCVRTFDAFGIKSSESSPAATIRSVVENIERIHASAAGEWVPGTSLASADDIWRCIKMKAGIGGTWK